MRTRPWHRLDRRAVVDLLLAGLAVAGVGTWLTSFWLIQDWERARAAPASLQVDVEQDLDFMEGGDHWGFRVTHPRRECELQPTELTVFRNRVRVHHQKADSGGWLAGLEVDETESPKGQRLICALEFPGAGHPYARDFFVIRDHQLIHVGRVGGENGGPEFHDYDGDGRPEWVFDNFNWYEHNTDGPDRFQVYKETNSGKLRLWKSLANPNRRHLKDPFDFHNL